MPGRHPRIYGQLVPILGKYSKFASAGDKAAVRQAADAGEPDAAPAADAAPDAQDGAAKDESAPL